jgi:hypothetical protein
VIAPTLDLECAELNIAMVASDGLALTFTFNVDLTGYAVSASVVNRKTRDVVQAITANLVQPNPGIVTLALTSAETLPLAGRGLDWWLRLTPGGGQPRTAIVGAFSAREL